MRQIVSTAVVAVIVGALAGATMSAVAQTEPAAERAISPAAGINAATVDGKSAVGYTNKKNRRRGKLVATNKVGELPSNIVRPFWGYIKNKPAILADGQVTWDEVVGKPADPKIAITTHVVSVGPADPINGSRAVLATCPNGKVIGGGHWGVNAPTNLTSSHPDPDTNSWRVFVTDAVNETFDVYAVCMIGDPSTIVSRMTPAAKADKGGERQ